MKTKRNHPARIVGIVQVKGGAGRSTVATNLAGELGKVGKTVLIDADMPQATAASWAAVRQQEGIDGAVVSDTAATHQELLAKLEMHAEDADYIVLDAPPRLAEMTRAILMASDLTLVPVGASVAELWATADVLDIITQAKKLRPIDARMLWTRFRPQTRLAQDLTDRAKDELGLPIMRSALGFRVVYAEALGEGRTVAELHDPHARDELHSLVAEIRRIIR